MNKYEHFKALHQGEEALFLGGAWDLDSAIALEQAGFAAIGTTSWGMAATLGLADGEQMSLEHNLATVMLIVKHVNIPVSADMEAGYAEDPKTIITNVLRMAETGVAGINLEDSLKGQGGMRDVAKHSQLLTDIRTALDANGFGGLFLNARTDTYFMSEQPLHDTISRGKAYADSGADGLFVPGIQEMEEIRAVASAIGIPLNVLSLPHVTDVRKLQECGVRRFSFGNALYDDRRAALMARAKELAGMRNTAMLYSK
ncbi:carboxyphosphonoenolpyruvate phosphonomutase [Paenibacillus swuensis]|uniref:Carboxyphosphonoenolpyruvate phosphonomutase n=1 Tax=Paenibacillus swuensis TaxID=1178515 RepID=A0A172TG06_9BACL|nr:isocitrate lyase/phosphoenolpyruvate mutase family protein [Paenibacillus swuensis]ANE45834.1 carboxyphosphonoenolpyruvate phosphonomutase [Paenibacillus swuensis]